MRAWLIRGSGVLLALVLIGMLIVQVPREDSTVGSTGTPADQNGGDDQQSGDAASRARCDDGDVFLGAAAGSIRFVVRCRSNAGSGVARFSVIRYAFSGGNSGSGIRAVQRRPPVKSKGSRRGFGHCELKRGIVVCRAQAGGRFKVRGRLWVAPRQRCEMGVGILVNRPVCRDGECEASEHIVYLARGKPEGC